MNDLLPAEHDELAHCETVIESGLQTFVEVGTALLRIRDGRLYRRDHGTFEGYCKDRWSIERRHAYRLMDAATVVANVSDRTQSAPANIEQTRPLAPLDPPQQIEAWSRAVETAPNGRPTAEHVKAAVAEVTGRAAPDTRRAPAPKAVVEITTEWQAAPGQTELWSAEDDAAEQARVEADDPDDFELDDDDAPSQSRFNGLDRAVQKTLGLVAAVDDFGLVRICAPLSASRRASLASAIDNLTGKLAKWSDHLKGVSV